MTYSASLEYLFGLQKHGIKPGLDTIARLLDGLGRPQGAYPTLHIGGTNGKGSTAAMAAAMLQATGSGSIRPPISSSSGSVFG